MLRFAVERRPATPAEVEAALARLDGGAGIYFGCDAGVAGLHPLQATLLVDPALAFEVFADGLEVAVLDAFGATLLAHPALSGFRGASPRSARPGSSAKTPAMTGFPAAHSRARC